MTYSINSGSDIPGVDSAWGRTRAREEIDGQVTFSNIAVNVWRVGRMTMANFETYQALQGTTLTSLETNDPDDRDAFNQYTDVVMSLISGRQDGIQMRDVTIRFMVNLDSEV